MDRSGEVVVDKPGVARLATWARDPPGPGVGGGDCGGAKHLQKKFFKKTFEVVDIKRKKQ